MGVRRYGGSLFLVMEKSVQHIILWNKDIVHNMDGGMDGHS